MKREGVATTLILGLLYIILGHGLVLELRGWLDIVMIICLVMMFLLVVLVLTD